jgi:hypothetical protein
MFLPLFTTLAHAYLFSVIRRTSRAFNQSPARSMRLGKHEFRVLDGSDPR